LQFGLNLSGRYPAIGGANWNEQIGKGCGK